MKDDLSSSVGAVMDLLGEPNTSTSFRLTEPSLGKLVTYNQVIEIIADQSRSYVS